MLIAEIKETKEFHQEIINYIQPIVIVIDDYLDIKYKNNAFEAFFGKNILNFNQIIKKHKELSVIKNILKFPETELTLTIKGLQFKLGFRQLNNNETLVLLSDISQIIKIQIQLLSQLNLKGLAHLWQVLLMK